MLSKLRISLLILLTCIVSPSLGQTEKIRFESLVDYAQKRVKQDAFTKNQGILNWIGMKGILGF